MLGNSRSWPFAAVQIPLIGPKRVTAPNHGWLSDSDVSLWEPGVSEYGLPIDVTGVLVIGLEAADIVHNHLVG